VNPTAPATSDRPLMGITDSSLFERDALRQSDLDRAKKHTEL